MNEPLTATERRALKKIQSKGGENNVAKNGKEHMKKIGALGGKAGKGKKKKRNA